MFKNYKVLILLLIISTFSLSGCLVRIYEKEMPRQDIVVSGNQGYIVGKPPRNNYVLSKKTRKIIVTEVELVNPKKLVIETGSDKHKIINKSSALNNSQKLAEKTGNGGYIYKKNNEEVKKNISEKNIGEESYENVSTNSSPEVTNEDQFESSGPVAPSENNTNQNKTVEYQTYKVQKGDTLQKISFKFYGKYSLWKRIFNANKDKLENPNSIYVGQKLRIPLDIKDNN